MNNDKELEVISESETGSAEKELDLFPEDGEKSETSTEETSTEESNEEMELSLDSEDDMKKMEAIIGQKVTEESSKKNRGNKKDKDKGKTEGNKGEDKGEDKKEDKKEEDVSSGAADLSSVRIMEREVKKGTVTCPQFRIVKVADGSYDILMAPELSIRTKELKYEKVGNNSKLSDAKHECGAIATAKFGEKFQHSQGDKTFEHEYYRFEMHKPGRDKDVTEIEKISQSKTFYAEKNKKDAKKSEDDAKKAAKEAEAKKLEEASKESTPETDTPESATA